VLSKHQYINIMLPIICRQDICHSHLYSNMQDKLDFFVSSHFLSYFSQIASTLLKSIKVLYSCQRNSISQLTSATCHMRSHSVTCHPTQVNILHFNHSQTSWSGTRFTYPEGMEGSVNLGGGLHTKMKMVYLPSIAQLGVELATLLITSPTP